MAEYEETVQKAKEAWKIWADVSKLCLTLDSDPRGNTP